MRGVTLNFQNGEISVQELPSPSAGESRILVANHHSLISAGTEGYIIRMARKGPLGKAMDRPDLFRQVLNKARVEGLWNTAQVVKNLIATPLPLGYSSAGVVIAVGKNVDLFRPGDHVACAGLGLANHAEHVSIPVTMAARLPENVPTEAAAFGTLGAVALHGVRLAKPELGHWVTVLGLGLLGQLTVQILKANGCRVIGFDINPSKVRQAASLGMDAGGVSGQDDLKEITLSHTGGRGADTVLITAHAKDNGPITTATELVREKGSIVAVGLINLDIPRRAFFEKEIRLEVSRAYGAGAYDSEYEQKGRDYPYGYVRWTEGRNLAAFIDLLALGKVRTDSLISHRFTLDRARDAYDIVLGEKQEPFIGVLFEYTSPAAPTTAVRFKNAAPESTTLNPLCFGVIGAGRFAQGVLLPFLASHSGIKIAGISTAQGMSANHVAKKYGCDFCATDAREVLDHPGIGSVLIATRHASHADLVDQALRVGKNVFVEKPLAINAEQLARLEATLTNAAPLLHVGFNRRFAPHCREFAKLLANRRQPLALTFRFATPRITKGHESEWVHDAESGGGRIVGEVCHMVDTASFLVGSPVNSVYARSIAGDAPGLANYDTLHVTITYADGSIALLSYVANGDPSIPQERIELFWESSYGVIDNFRTALVVHNGRKRSLGGWNQQKGWKEEIAAFVRAVGSGGPPLIPRENLVETTRVTFLIQESLATGQAATMPPRPVMK